MGFGPEGVLLVEIHSDPNHSVICFGPVVVVFWLKRITPDACHRLLVSTHEHASRQPDGRIVVASVSLPGCEPPDPMARRALAGLSRGTANRVVRLAIIREGQGFIASAVSSIVTGIRVLAGSSTAQSFFTDLDEGLRWTLNGLDIQVDREELTAAIQRYQVSLASQNGLGGAAHSATE